MDFLNALQSLWPQAKVIVLVAPVALGIIALAGSVYLTKTAFGPFIKVVQWLFAYTPGERPSDLVSGISYGGRMLAWASLVALAVWFFFG